MAGAENTCEYEYNGKQCNKVARFNAIRIGKEVGDIRMLKVCKAHLASYCSINEMVIVERL